MGVDVGPLDFTVMNTGFKVGFMINSATRWPRIRGLFDVTGLPTSAVHGGSFRLESAGTRLARLEGLRLWKDTQRRNSVLDCGWIGSEQRAN